ncbi:MAG TPA: cell division FtsA domain-containing protein [bacterium]|jgi:cell division protein FtsA|nr:cell division FtsA domain-containing protein [bacterium]
MQPEFSLDVGTRKVCGVLVDSAGAGLPRIAHYAVCEHPGRAMMDGQVHVISQAARIIAEVKAQLEHDSGLRLRKAHVAVAGRSLAVSRARLVFKCGKEAMSREEVAAMEHQAVREARSSLPDPRVQAGAHCVGYSVLSATLDGQPLADLTGHKGEEVAIEVLATFLPKLALDSLQAALAEAGLTAESLTLEPIAAVQLMVPQELRRLNLGLVDVGAGTSDVALTRDGRVDAYTMVPVAGDEVTERLADAFLLDFMQAEALKRSPAGEGAEVTDIFGVRRSVSAEDLERELGPARLRWAKECADALRALNNGKAPRAVILTGGGSLLTGASSALAAALSLAPERVGHRPLSAQNSFAGLPEGLLWPWAVTPLGIAASAHARRGLPFVRFQVNGKEVTAVNLKQSFTAFDALLAAGKERGHFHGRTGLATLYSVNGQERVAKGGMGGACGLFIGGSKATLDSPLKEGDSLTFIDAEQGQDGLLSYREALEREGLTRGRFHYNGEARSLPLEFTADGLLVEDLDARLPDRARLEVRAGLSLRRLLESEGVDLEGLIHRQIAVTVEGEPRVLLQRNYSLRLNGREAPLDSAVAASDRVEFEPGSGFQERIRDLWGPGEAARQRTAADGATGAVSVLLNGVYAPLDRVERVWMNGRETGLDEFLIDGADLRVERGGPCRTVAEGILRLGLAAWLESGRLKISLNGRGVGPEEALSDGDALDLSLEQEKRVR